MQKMYLSLAAWAAAMLLAGCVSSRETFEGRDPDQVWTAMVAAARTPDYREPEEEPAWIVRENEVWVDEANSRIEIFRRIERDYYKPASRHIHNDREWKITVAMTDRNPPAAKFTVRQLSIPSYAWEEARRYFDQVHAILGIAPSAAKSNDAAPTPPSTQPADSKIDIESLEPTK